MRCPRHPAVAQFSLAQRERTLLLSEKMIWDGCKVARYAARRSKPFFPSAEQGSGPSEPALSKWSMVKENGFTLSRLSLECFVLSSSLPPCADGTRIAATQSLDTTPLSSIASSPLKERARVIFSADWRNRTPLYYMPIFCSKCCIPILPWAPGLMFFQVHVF